MSDERIGVGIIGANVRYGWGTRAHIPALQALPEFELRAVATTRMETARARARSVSASRTPSIAPRRSLRTPEVDLVLVCVRVPSHFELTKLAISAGKHVFTEWPLGANLAEAVELRRPRGGDRRAQHGRLASARRAADRGACGS